MTRPLHLLTGLSWARAWCGAVALLILCGPSSATPSTDIQTADTIAAHAAEGAAAMQAGRFDDAAMIYEELTSARPNDAGLLMNLGMARYMAGHPEAALGPLQKSVRLNPSLAPASLFLGGTLLDLGRRSSRKRPCTTAH
jgi:Flp pilus assembly protein TadD